MFKKLLLLSMFCFWLLFGYAQNLTKMNAWQDSLVKASAQMFGPISEAERIESNFKFVKTLVSSLKETNAFNYSFDKLNSISILDSPDKSFRIFSWNIPLDDGSYLYYGAIQHKGPRLKLTALLDKTFEIKDVNSDLLEANNWYGAQYYDMVQLNPMQFVLLGWKGHHVDYSHKVIEILTIKPNGEILFGANIFSDQPNISRRIFSYTRQASMYLKYNKEKRRLEFDNIVPVGPSMQGNFKYYGPDLSYDGYVFDSNSLKLVENLEIHNISSGDEDNYIDPRKSVIKQKSGLR